MPTRGTYQQATPSCPCRMAVKPSVKCGKTLHWLHESGNWNCPTHGAVLTAQMAVEQMAA